ncbi:ferritin-like domain-containing protein [Streptomyces sp. TLI_146]|uniref:ferritin-like domain-containing protein n=1 Tax=Streptomyces sp. TLI_146 TaxID=1938858 RepID=UPI000C713134|nr:ferritin-like domain-containing protein [Streptomyces sp. TLI_146]PKV89641.1 aerobic-type carbon monoxide dehydrogenase small subunit (CoxS/CutS family) [Streptomyces sp. TLI_146]
MQEPNTDLDLTVNGVRHHGRSVPGDMSLVHFLHEDLGLTGTKIGCSIGECRACTVAVRTRPQAPVVTRQACMTSMRHVRGWDVTTVEGLAADGALHPVQQAFLEREAFQCGYCAAGFAVAGSVVVDHAGQDRATDDAEQPLEETVDTVLGSHVCRCTDYERYRAAVLATARSAAPTERELGPPAPQKHLATGATTGEAMPRPSRTPTLSAADTDRLGYTPVFDDPTLELIRLLRDGAEIEHSLLVQYLYAAFSIKVPRFADLAGWPSHRYGGRPLHLMGVAIEEMTHLDIVNSLLVALGAAPHLGRQQFPYEQDIYPFDFVLEPLSLHSLAKYVYVEASPSAVDPAQQHTPEDRAFVDRLYEVLGSTAPAAPRPNQVGSLYRKVTRVLELLQEREPDRLDYTSWFARLELLREEGESEHFALFRSMFEGTHPALQDCTDVWNPAGPDHPVVPLSHSSGLPPSGDPVPDETVPALRHLANLHYWAVCMLLDASYRQGMLFHSAARRHMTGPLRSLGTALAHRTEGLPFDAFVAGYAPGLDTAQNLRLAHTMVQQITIAQQRYARHLPYDYPANCALETLWELSLVRPT